MHPSLPAASAAEGCRARPSLQRSTCEQQAGRGTAGSPCALALKLLLEQVTGLRSRCHGGSYTRVRPRRRQLARPRCSLGEREPGRQAGRQPAAPQTGPLLQRRSSSQFLVGVKRARLTSAGLSLRMVANTGSREAVSPVSYLHRRSGLAAMRLRSPNAGTASSSPGPP